MGANIPERFVPSDEQVRLGVISDWYAGRVALYRGDRLQAWGELVDQVAHDLDARLDIKLDFKTGIGYARVNKGFPLEMQPYSPEAKEWARTQPVWTAQHSSWNKLFLGEPRGIC
jgi:hypothetical protein